MALLYDVREQIKSDLVIIGTAYDAQIDSAIRSALRDLRSRKFWFLEAVESLTLSSGDTSLTLPDDFGCAGEFELIAGGLRLSHSKGFDFVSFNDLRSTYWTSDPVQSGQPCACAVSGSTLYFSHTADQNYTIPAIYYRKDETPPTETQTSVWFDDGYDVVRSKAMFMFKRDSQQYTPTEEDGSRAAGHLKELSRRHEQYEGSR